MDNYESDVVHHSSFETPTAKTSRYIMRIKNHRSILTVIQLSAGNCLLPDTVYIRLTHHPHHYFRYVITQRLPSTISCDLLLSEATLPLLVAARWKSPIWGGGWPGSSSSIRRVSIPSPRNERSSRKLLAQIWTSKSPVSQQTNWPTDVYFRLTFHFI